MHLLRSVQLRGCSPKQLLEAINLADFQYILDDDMPTDEIDYVDYSSDVVDLINRCNVTTKTSQCLSTVRALVLQNKPVVLWCIFVETIRHLADVLSTLGIKVRCVYGEVELTERQQILNNFRNGEFQVLITNPNTLAESVSLHSICHDAMYYEYSFNLVQLLQSKDRIHRLGLPQEQYTQFYFWRQCTQMEAGTTLWMSRYIHVCKRRNSVCLLP